MEDKLRYLHYRRLEPARPTRNLSRGFSAEVHDPLWMLGRQWQMGEHRGEDASSPVFVTYESSEHPIEHPLQDAQVTPAEAIIEAEPDSWWTPGRRIRFGVQVQKDLNLPLPPDKKHAHLLFDDLPSPYQVFNRQSYDGLKLFKARATLGLPRSIARNVPRHHDDWDPSRLVYDTDFSADGSGLQVHRHRGGRVDWYSADATEAVVQPPEITTGRVYPTPMTYPGAPHPRWWQIENARVDIAGFPPDRAHFATLLLIDLIVSHSDDWFLFPTNTQAGAVLTLHDVRVRDSFDEVWELRTPREIPGQGPWSIFGVEGLDDRSLLVWPTAVTPVHGPVLEDVVLGMDEDANILWAVETRLEGLDIPAPAVPEPTPPAAGEENRPVDTGARKTYRYEVQSEVYKHWQPYVIQTVEGKRRFVQGRLADDRGASRELLPPATAKVLRNLDATEQDPVHEIEPGAVPSQGMQLQRRYVLARDVNGQPVLWRQRHRKPLLAPPALRLRHDLLVDEIQRQKV